MYEEKKTAIQQKWSYASVYRLSELLLIPSDALRGQLGITAASLAKECGDCSEASQVSLFLMIMELNLS